MFDLSLETSLLLRRVVESAKLLTEKISFRVNGKGMTFSSWDVTKSVIVDFLLPSMFCKEFHCDSEDHKFTMSTDSLMNVLKTSSSDEECRIQMCSPSSDFVDITFISSTGKTRKTRTRLEEEPEEPVGIPQKVEYSAVIRLNSSDFQKEISNFHTFDEVNVKADVHGVKFTGKNEKQRFETSYESDNQDLNSSINVEFKENTDKNFSRKFLEIFARAAPISETVELGIWDFMCVKYSIGDGGHLKFYLAAKIETEEEEMDL